VRTSIPLPADVHTRLRGLAALRGITSGELAAELIARGLAAAGIRVFCQSLDAPSTADPAAGEAA
jgi:hypothetical protein